MKINGFLLSIVFVSLFVLQGCIDWIGDYSRSYKEIGNGVISSANSSFSVFSEESEFSGLEIRAVGDFSGASTSFKVQSGKLPKFDKVDGFTPIDELLVISNDNEFSESPFVIQIPIETSDGAIPLALVYNRYTKELEPLSFIDYDEHSITVAASHFTTYNYKANYKSVQVNDESPDEIEAEIMEEMDILVGEFDLLSTYSDIFNVVSDFTVGEDDWEFPNYGSAMQPGGACSGHSLSALLYYDYKCKSGLNSEALSGRYDVDDKLWQDNTLGIRLASMAQRDVFKILNDEKYNDLIYHGIGDQDEIVNEYHKKAFRNAILQIHATNKPVLTFINQEDKLEDGHAVLITAINRSDSTIHIADPNFPGVIQTAKIDGDGKFNYTSLVNSGSSNDIKYTRFNTFGYGEILNWKLLFDYWLEFFNGTIGDDYFPECSYSLILNAEQSNEKKVAISEVDKVWLAGVSVDKEHEKIRIKCEATGIEDDSLVIRVWHHEGWETSEKNFIEIDMEYWDLYSSTIGVFIGKKIVNKQGQVITDAWLDFKWLKFGSFKIEPAELKGEIEEEYTWSIVMEDQPDDMTFEWDFGDSYEKVYTENDEEIKHTYSENGTYTIQVKAYTKKDDKFIGAASAIAKIGRDPLDVLHEAKFIDVNFGYFKFNKENHPEDWIRFLTDSEKDSIIVWDGLNFSWSNSIDNISAGAHYRYMVDGKVSATCDEIVEISCYRESYYSYSDGAWSRDEFNIKARNIPLNGEFNFDWYKPIKYKVDEGAISNLTSYKCTLENKWSHQSSKDTRVFSKNDISSLEAIEVQFKNREK